MEDFKFTKEKRGEVMVQQKRERERFNKKCFLLNFNLKIIFYWDVITCHAHVVFSIYYINWELTEGLIGSIIKVYEFI